MQQQRQQLQIMKNNDNSCDDRNSSISNSNLDDMRNGMQHHRHKVLGMCSVTH